MNDLELEAWFTANRKRLETAYTAETEPWKQSGFSGPQARWIACRQPIAECIDYPGTFLDIGCANGYLLQCLLQWTGERGIEIQPYGLEISAQLATLAKQRLARYATHIFISNAWTWVPPIKFDFVRTEVVYVPEPLRANFVRRLMKLFVKSEGKLLVVEYRSNQDRAKPWIDTRLQAWGIRVERCLSGYYQERELTRIAVVQIS